MNDIKDLNDDAFRFSKIVFNANVNDALRLDEFKNVIMNNFLKGNYEVKYSVLLDAPIPFKELYLIVQDICINIKTLTNNRIQTNWNDLVLADETTEEGMEIVSATFYIEVKF
jgi:hypothetical protein